jgi:D-alanyl-D-alanine carboxypeptidase (penicillin-binding protein 5/6)
MVLNIFAFAFSPAMAAAQQENLQLDAGSAILMELETGQILYEYNADEALPPASMSKMMTEYLVLDAVKSGQISWDDVVTVRENAASVIGSRIFLAEGDKHTVRELYIAMAIASANDASVALAEFIAGTEENFAQRMNEKAREIGLSEQAHFINATGLNRADMKEKFRPQSIQGETLLTAKDTALLALNLLRDHPEALEFSSITQHKFRARDDKPMTNLNWMLEDWEGISQALRKFAYPGMDGLKTGHTKEAGYCFTGTAERDGMRLISVVMNTKSEEKRFEETRKLMDYGFNNFQKKTVLAAKSEIDELKTVKISKGVKTEVPVVVESGVALVMRNGDSDEQIEISVEPLAEEQLVAPIKQGDVVGTVKVTYNGPVPVEKQVNLVAAADVEKGSWIRLFFRAVKNFFGDLFLGIKNMF